MAGDRLPSRRDIAKTFKINPNTVQRAFKSLEEEGIIVSEANVPSRVTENQMIIQQLKRDALEQAMAVFYDTTQVLNMDPHEIATYMTEYFQNEVNKMIEIEKVNKFYAKKILENVSFSIKPGEITALIGENGSGKRVWWMVWWS